MRTRAEQSRGVGLSRGVTVLYAGHVTAFPPACGFPVGDPPTPEFSELGGPALFLADAIDPTTGEYRSIQRGVDPTEAAAIELLRVRRKSGSAVQDQGQRFDQIESVDDQLAFRIRSEIEYAWRNLISSGQIRIDELKIDGEGDTANVRILFTNLVTGKSNRPGLVVPLLALLPRTGT